MARQAEKKLRKQQQKDAGEQGAVGEGVAAEVESEAGAGAEAEAEAGDKQQHPRTKLVLLSENVKELSELPARVRELASKHGAETVPYALELDYSYFNFDQV